MKRIEWYAGAIALGLIGVGAILETLRDERRQAMRDVPEHLEGTAEPAERETIAPRVPALSAANDSDRYQPAYWSTPCECSIPCHNPGTSGLWRTLPEITGSGERIRRSNAE